MYILDRLILFSGSLLGAFLVLAPFRTWLKSKPRLSMFLILILTQIPVLFGPAVLFPKAIEGNESSWFDSYRHVDQTSYLGYIYSVSVKTETGPDETVTWNRSRLSIYKSLWIGYETEDDAKSLVYVYDDHQGERELIFFHWHVRADGSTFVVVTHNLEDPVSSLIIEDRPIELHFFQDPNYAYFVLSAETPFDCFSDSILLNGIEIGDLLGR
jgi:hypothetical protein